MEYRGLHIGCDYYDEERDSYIADIPVFDKVGIEYLRIEVPLGLERKMMGAIDEYCARHGIDAPKTHERYLRESDPAALKRLYPDAV